MAVDTENKRRGAINLLPLTVAPVPDGTIDAADRAQAAWVYSGIASIFAGLTCQPGAFIIVGTAVTFDFSGGRRSQGLLLGVY